MARKFSFILLFYNIIIQLTIVTKTTDINVLQIKMSKLRTGPLSEIFRNCFFIDENITCTRLHVNFFELLLYSSFQLVDRFGFPTTSINLLFKNFPNRFHQSRLGRFFSLGTAFIFCSSTKLITRFQRSGWLPSQTRTIRFLYCDRS